MRGQHQVPGHLNQFRSDLVSEHLPPGEEGPSEAFLLKKAETSWTPLSAAHKLYRDTIERILCLSATVARELHRTGPGMGGENGSLDCRRYTPTRSGLPA